MMQWGWGYGGNGAWSIVGSLLSVLFMIIIVVGVSSRTLTSSSTSRTREGRAPFHCSAQNRRLPMMPTMSTIIPRF